MVVTSSGVSVLPLYAGKVWVGVAPRKLFQTQSEEPYLVRWAVFCEAVECVRSRHGISVWWSEPRSHTHDGCRCYCRSELCTRMVTRLPMKGVGSRATLLKRYQVVVRMQDQMNCIRDSLESSEPIPFPNHVGWLLCKRQVWQQRIRKRLPETSNLTAGLWVRLPPPDTILDWSV